MTLVQASSGLAFSAPADNIQVDSQLDNITFNQGNGGELQPWKQLNVVGTAPTARRHAGMASGEGYAYQVGGLTGAPAASTTVDYVKVNSDGTLGTWATTTALPAARYAASVVASNGYLYVVGGCSDSSATAACTTAVNTVYYAAIKPDGTVGAWQTNAFNLPANRGYASASVANGNLYVIGGHIGTGTPTPQTTVYYGRINADGAVYNTAVSGGWSSGTVLNTATYGQQTLVANGGIYLIGGCTDAVSTCTTPTSTVQFASTSTAGLGAWTAATALPKATGLHTAVLMNGNIYVIGGRSGSAPVSTVMYNKVNGDGSLGQWITSAYSLPAARQGASSLMSIGYIWTIGGYDGTSVLLTPFSTSGARTMIYGSLDLLSLTGQSQSDANGGSTLNVGDTKIVGGLRVDGTSSLNGGLIVTGPINFYSPGTGGTVLNLSNTTTGINLLNIKDLNTNFGSAITGGAFISRNSYFGEEFNVGNGATPATGQTCTGNVTATEIGWDRGDFGSHLAPAVACGTSASPGSGEFNFSTKLGATTASDQCQALSPAVTQANGAERLLAQATATVANSAVCVETLSAGQAVSNKIYAAANLPVVTMKVKMSTLTNDNSARVYIGMSASDTATGAGVGMPGNGIFFSNCSGYSQTAPTGCSNTTWYGYAASANAAVAGTPVTCSTGSGSLTAQFSYLRIEVRATNDIHFFADYNTADGIQESECGTGSTAAASASAMAPWIQTTIGSNVAATAAVDVDYFRSWQDDNIPSAATAPENPNTDVTPSGQQLITMPPISPNDPDPQAAGSFFNFNANSSEDSVFNNDVYVKGTLFADKIKANQIEGLEIFTDKISSLQEQLNREQHQQGAAQADISNQPPTNPDPQGHVLGDSALTLQSVTIALDLNVVGSLTANGGLVVGGAADFQGETRFQKLVSFMDRVVFRQDVSFQGRTTFNNDTGGFAVIHPTQTEVKVKFTRAYDSEPVVSVNVRDGQFVSYTYKDLTKEGFTIIIKDPATQDITFAWTALHIDNAQTQQQPVGISARQ
jgi:hypothetical protein